MYDTMAPTLGPRHAHMRRYGPPDPSFFLPHGSARVATTHAHAASLLPRGPTGEPCTPRYVAPCALCCGLLAPLLAAASPSRLASRAAAIGAVLQRAGVAGASWPHRACRSPPAAPPLAPGPRRPPCRRRRRRSCSCIITTYDYDLLLTTRRGVQQQPPTHSNTHYTHALAARRAVVRRRLPPQPPPAASRRPPPPPPPPTAAVELVHGLPSARSAHCQHVHMSRGGHMG